MDPTDDRRPRLNTSEVAEMFGVTRATLYRWISEGRIPELMKDPDNGWPIWQQPDLDAVARLVKNKRRKAVKS